MRQLCKRRKILQLIKRESFASGKLEIRAAARFERVCQRSFSILRLSHNICIQWRYLAYACAFARSLC